MKSILWRVLFCLSLSVGFVCSQDSSEKPTERTETRSGSQTVWYWIDFGVFAAGLGFLVVKNAPAFFSARSKDIQKAIEDATGLKIQADFRSSEIDRKMASLDGEVKRMRDEAQQAMERERQRIELETVAAVEKLEERTDREIEALRTSARSNLTRYTAQLAVSMATSELRDTLSAEDKSGLVYTFSHDLAQGRN